MDPIAESDVLVGLAGNIQLIGILELGRVSVRRPEDTEDDLSRLDGAAIDLQLLHSHAAGTLDGAVVAQELLYRGWDERWIVL